MRNHTLRTFGIILLIHIRQMEKCKNCWFHLNNEHFMQTNDVFPRRIKNVPQITLLNVKRSNRIGFIKVFSITLDLKYGLCSIIAKPALEFGCNSLFCTNINNGLKEIARLTIQCQNPDIKRFCNLSTKFCES